MRRQKSNAHPVVRIIKSEQKKIVVILILSILVLTTLMVPVRPLQGISNEMNVEYPRDSNLNGYQTAFGENWLSGWSYRKSYTIEKTLGAGINYTIPIVVYSGIGADTGNTVYLNSESRMDLGDVRFTGEDGEELLSFWLEDYIRSYSSDYFADDCKYFSVSPNHYPHAYYYNGRTYVVWHGEGENDDDAGNPFIRYYDHSTRYWSTSVQIGTNQLLDDFHGSPNVWVDDEGYIHSLFGSHAGLIPLQHAKSNEPESISDGFTITELDWRATYPSVFYDSSNDVTHLWYRYYNGAGQFDWRYVNSSDNGITWNTQHIFIDVDDGTGYIPYRYGSTGLDPYSKDRIHMSWSVYDEADPHEYENVYYAYLNLIDMHAYNVEGIDLGTTIDVNEMQNYCLVLDTNNHGACAGSVHTDSKGIPYIMFASEYNDGSGHQYFTYWNSSSSSWVTPEQVCNVNRYSSVPDFIVYDSNNITAFLTQGEDLTRWTWDGSNWMKVEIIKSATSSRDVSFGFPVAPYGTYPQEDLQITFCEWYNAYDNKAFAWGSQGIVSDYSLQGAIFWVRLSGNLSENSQTIYIYYGNQAASSTSNGFETFPLFDDFNRPSSTIVDGTWTEDEGNGILSIEMNQLKIIQEQNEYCHIEQSSPLQSTLVLRGKMKSGDNTGVNWSPALAIYWNSYDWIKIGMNDYAGEFMTLMNVDSVILSNSSGGALSGSWYYYRIRVGIDVVCAEYSTDGLNWNLLTQISRPVVWIGYPSLIILGKGYAEDSDTFPGSNLDNSLSTPGFLGSHYIDDVFVRKYVDSDPVYGYWGGDENPNITQYSDTYIAGFRETLPDDIMFRPDDETYGEGYVESFTDISDWTVHTGNPLTSDGDVGRWENTGDTYKFVYTTTPSFSTMEGLYIEVRYRGNQSSLHGTIWGYKSDIFGYEMAFHTDTLYPDGDVWQSQKWYLPSLNWYNPGPLECISFELSGEGSNWYFEVDYIRIGISTEFGFQHDGSDTAGVTSSGGGYVSSDGEYLSLIADSDGSRFEVVPDISQTTAMMATTYYPFLSIDIHEENMDDYLMVEIYNGQVWTVIQENTTVGLSTRHWSVSFIGSYVEKLRISVSPYANIRINYIKLYSIANFTIAQSGIETDDYLYVDSGVLVCAGNPTYFELNHDPVIMVDTARFGILEVNSTCSLFETSYHIDSWSAWDARSIYEMDIGTMTDIRMRFESSGTLVSIAFGRSSMRHDPEFFQAPDCNNIDDTNKLYARFKDYQMTVYALDEDGSSDIDYLELTLASDDRTYDYWTIRYDVATNTYSEQIDPFDYITLNSGESTTVSSEDSIQITFVLSINWNHPDLSNTDTKCFIVDSVSISSTSYYEVNWAVETRLDIYSGLTLSDGFGTPDRGNINGEILASGFITYLGSNIHPLSTEIDIYIVSEEVMSNPWLAIDYQSTNGAFSVIVVADDEVGEDIYEVRVVRDGQAEDDINLLHSAHTRTYIADSISTSISLDSELSTNESLIFYLELVYMFDDTPVNEYTAVISKNGQNWRTVSSGAFTDSRNESVTNTYSVVSVNASLHGITSIYVPTSFVVSSGGASSTSNPSSIPQTEDLVYLIRVADYFMQWLDSLLLSINTNIISNIMDAIHVLAEYQNVMSPGLIMIGAVSSLPLILGGRWIHRRDKRTLDRRTRAIFQERGGLEVYSLVNAGNAKEGVYMVVGGVEMPCLLLEDYNGTVSERFKSFVASGERPTRLLVLHSEFLLNKEDKLTVYGLIVPPRLGI